MKRDYGSVNDGNNLTQIVDKHIIRAWNMPAPTFMMADAVDLLLGSWGSLTREVLKGQFAFWLGSGISRERFPDVQTLLMEVLTLLHQKIDPHHPDCPYLKSITKIMELTSVRDLAPEAAPNTWAEPRRKELLNQLQGRYGDVLEQDVRAAGGTVTIRWDLLKLHERYGDSSILPDAEHRFVALLIEEGIVSELITTNWDALIEIAHEKCRAGKPPNFQTIACKDEWNRNGYTSRLIKIHGCARQACAHGPKYRDFLVATRTDIRNWCVEPRFEPFKTVFKATLREKTALFIGLSAQDWNIQAECSGASFGQGHFPTTPPKVYFAEPALTITQQAVLRAVYGEDAYNRDPDTIDAKATLPLFAKPLLGTFFLLTVLEKSRTILNADNADLKTEHRMLVFSIIDQTVSFLKAQHDAIPDGNQRWRKLAEDLPGFISRLLSVFRRQTPLPTKEAYEAISSDNVAKMQANPHQFHDLQWLLFTLSVIQEGKNRGFWQVIPPASPDGKEGQIRMARGAASIPVFVLQKDTGLACLVKNGFVDPSAPHEFLMIYPSERKRAPKRITTPNRSLPGSSAPTHDNEIWMRTEMDEAANLGELFDNLKLRAAVTLPV